MNVLFYNGPNFDTIDIELTRRQYILGNDYIHKQYILLKLSSALELINTFQNTLSDV